MKKIFFTFLVIYSLNLLADIPLYRGDLFYGVNNNAKGTKNNQINDQFIETTQLLQRQKDAHFLKAKFKLQNYNDTHENNYYKFELEDNYQLNSNWKIGINTSWQNYHGNVVTRTSSKSDNWLIKVFANRNIELTSLSSLYFQWSTTFQKFNDLSRKDPLYDFAIGYYQEGDNYEFGPEINFEFNNSNDKTNYNFNITPGIYSKIKTNEKLFFNVNAYYTWTYYQKVYLTNSSKKEHVGYLASSIQANYNLNKNINFVSKYNYQLSHSNNNSNDYDIHMILIGLNYFY